MFDRFTERAQTVMALSRKHSLQLNHDYIDTEHILLGILEEGNGVAVYVLKSMKTDLDGIRKDLSVRKNSRANCKEVQEHIPFTPSTKRVLGFAITEAKALRWNYLGTEHLLLGLFREQDGLAAQVLTRAGLKLDAVRNAIVAYRDAIVAQLESENNNTQNPPQG